MRIFSRLGPVALGLLVILSVACGDSAAPAVTANTLVRVSGDSQANLTGSALAQPLKVRVNGTDGQPYPGATVTWSVIGGSAVLGSPTALSDSAGGATTTVTLGAAPGAVSIQASVASVTPVTFGAKACAHPVFTLNDTLPGALATTDCRLGGYYTDFFDLNVPAGSQGMVLTMESTGFDTYLELYLRSFALQGFDDDIDYPANTNAQLTAIVAPGDYLIAPSSAELSTIGDYTLSVITQQPALAGCEIVWVTRGVDISDSVTTGDCVDSTSGRYYADVVAMRLEAGTTLKVNHRSTAFDAALFLYNGSGIAVASNNDSANAGTTTNAFISFPVVTSGFYLLFAGTNDTVATGSYDLSIASTTTAAASPRDRGPEVLQMGGLRWPKGRAARSWSHSGT
ncbi:MAG TPA: Ig-like domain-containing protein [Gemmatimonadales bacterium]|jgi:hypothetical protein|nr:Ig-like domain-containing protein [Gemmatimonadales bacterium]